VIFDGIESWPENEPLVELRTGDRIIDLHNWASFVGFDYRLPETLMFRFDFDQTEGGLRGGSSSKQVGLRFEGVYELRVHKQKLENMYEGDTLSDFLYRKQRPGRGWVQVTMMDGFTISFEAGAVVLEEDGTGV
jgi:hypothetical protein